MAKGFSTQQLHDVIDAFLNEHCCSPSETIFYLSQILYNKIEHQALEPEEVDELKDWCERLRLLLRSRADNEHIRSDEYARLREKMGLDPETPVYVLSEKFNSLSVSDISTTFPAKKEESNDQGRIQK